MERRAQKVLKCEMKMRNKSGSIAPAYVFNPWHYLILLPLYLQARIWVKKVRGIDISHHQTALDWRKVKACGIDFAIIRAGRDVTVDRMFHQHIKGAIDAGLSGRRVLGSAML